MEGTRFNADCSVHLAAGGIQSTTCHVFFLSILMVMNVRYRAFRPRAFRQSVPFIQSAQQMASSTIGTFDK